MTTMTEYPETSVNDERVKLQRSESFEENGFKVLQSILSSSASVASNIQHQNMTDRNGIGVSHRSLSAQNLSFHIPTTTSINDHGLPPIASQQQRRSIMSRNPMELDSFVRQFETKIREQSLIWQKELQKLLDKKNSELESIKSSYESKLRVSLENNKKFELLINQLNDENKRIKYELEHQIKSEQIQIKNDYEQYKQDMERKFSDMKTFYEDDKQEMKKHHNRIYQDLLDETNQRLKKMENDYKYQQQTNDSSVSEMEKRLGEFRTNVERLQQSKQKVEEEKLQLQKTNEQLTLQNQELTGKIRHNDRDYQDQVQRYENELKSVKVRCESGVELLKKENDLTKTKATKTIDELEKQLGLITEKFYDMQKLFEQKLADQQKTYQINLSEYENEYEKKLNTIKFEQTYEKFEQFQKHNDLLQNELKQKVNEIRQINDLYMKQKELNEKNEKKIEQIKNDSDSIYQEKIKELNEKNRQNEHLLTENLNKEHMKLIEQLRLKYEQDKEMYDEKMKNHYNKELNDLKVKYEQIIEKQDEKFKQDIKQQEKMYNEKRLTYDNEKQQIINDYEQFIKKIEKQYEYKNNEYEKRIEMLIAKTHEQLKSIEDEFQERNVKQQSIINDQQKMIQVFKDEQSKIKSFYDKQFNLLSDQCIKEKNEIKSQFDSCMKNLEKNFSTLTLKKEQLERKLSYLSEQHKHELIECKISYENNLKGLLSNDVRLDLENTIQSLKQQILYLQQRIAFLQNELEQYVQNYGHSITNSSRRNKTPTQQ